MNTCRYTSLPVALALAAIATSCGGFRSGGETAPVNPADFRNAVTAEVRNAQDQVVLSGKFAETATDADEVERKAALTGTGVDADASGEAEVESCRGDCRSQEVEFSVVNLQPSTVFRLVIDGKDFATVTTDARGRASVERNVPFPR